MSIRSVLLVLLISGTMGVLGAAAADQTGSSGQGGTANPFAGNAEAVKTGRQIFLRHGLLQLSRGRGERRWYRARPHSVETRSATDVTTVHDGRPGNADAVLGKQLYSEQIWKVVTYLQSLRQGA